jgi:hypothetical protein
VNVSVMKDKLEETNSIATPIHSGWFRGQPTPDAMKIRLQYREQGRMKNVAAGGNLKCAGRLEL